MNSNPATTTTTTKTTNIWLSLLIVALVIVLAVVSVMSAYKHVKPLEIKEADIPRFKVDAHWDPYPSTIDIENQYDCNADSLRKCSLDDPTTLFGCKELAVRCHHFDEDTQYFTHGEKRTIPKNSEPNEGYALAITSLVEACNPYHGDLTLVAKNADSTDYMLICTCKEPGYIGNDDILGACESVYICNGKIDDINKPLNQIECICGPRETNVRYDDGLPVCKTLLVHEANERFADWTHLVPFANPNATLEKSVFNATIRDNLKISRLIDPCRKPLDATKSNETLLEASYDYNLRSCVVRGEGIPVRIELLEKKADDGGGGGGGGGGSGKDEEEDDDKKPAPYKPVDAVVNSKSIQYVRLIDKVGGKRMRMNVKTKLPAYKNGEVDVYVNLPDNVGFGDSAQVYFDMKDQINGGRCEGNWPTYHCYMRNYFAGKVFGVPYPGYRSPPGGFWWNTEDWSDIESAVPKGAVLKEGGVTLNNDHLTTREYLYGYGMKYCSTVASDDDPMEGKCITGMLSFNDKDDYKKHKNVLT